MCVFVTHEFSDFLKREKPSISKCTIIVIILHYHDQKVIIISPNPLAEIAVGDLTLLYEISVLVMRPQRRWTCWGGFSPLWPAPTT